MKTSFKNLFIVFISIVISAVLFNACSNPTDLGNGTPVDPPKPFVLKEDSVIVDLSDDDDYPSSLHHRYTLSSRARFVDLRDTSIVTLDTSGAVPKISMKLFLTPSFESEDDAKKSRLKQVQFVLDPTLITGDDWVLVNNNQVKFLVRVFDKPPMRDSLISIVQQRPGPYTKDESYAAMLAWKLTAKREIVIRLEAQLTYSSVGSGGVNREHARVLGVIRLKY